MSPLRNNQTFLKDAPRGCFHPAFYSFTATIVAVGEAKVVTLACSNVKRRTCWCLRVYGGQHGRFDIQVD